MPRWNIGQPVDREDDSQESRLLRKFNRKSHRHIADDQILGVLFKCHKHIINVDFVVEIVNLTVVCANDHFN